jgi:hypothetical protein
MDDRPGGEMPAGFDRQSGGIDQVRLSVCTARSSRINGLPRLFTGTKLRSWPNRCTTCPTRETRRSSSM